MKTLIFKLPLCGMLLFMFCNQSNKANLQERNYSPLVKATYTRDSLRIIRMLRSDLKNHKDFFFSKEYFDSTQIIIDTIIYDPDYKKFAAFVITENPTARQLLPDERSDWYYNGNCYLGIKKLKDSILLSSTGPRFTNSINKADLVSLMHAEYFSVFARLKDEQGNLRYKYNLGDVRFWDCPIWQEIENREQQRRVFEKEKKEHPQNVYDPASKN